MAARDERLKTKNYRQSKTLFLIFPLRLKNISSRPFRNCFFSFRKNHPVCLLFLVIILIFQRVKIIKGYDFNQVVVFYLIFNLIDTLAQVFFRGVYRFKYYVISGNFNLILTKPHHPFLQILVGGVDFLDLLMLIPYFFLFLFFVLKIPNLNFFSFFVFGLLIVNSLLIATAFHIFVLAFGILTTETDNTIMIYRDLANLGRFSLEIYKNPVRELITFLIPLGVMISFPAKAFLVF